MQINVNDWISEDLSFHYYSTKLHETRRVGVKILFLTIIKTNCLFLTKKSEEINYTLIYFDE